MSFNPSHVLNAYASYDVSFAQKHNLSAVAGINYEHQQTADLLGYRSDVLSESLNDLNLAVGANSRLRVVHRLMSCSVSSFV